MGDTAAVLGDNWHSRITPYTWLWCFRLTSCLILPAIGISYPIFLNPYHLQMPLAGKHVSPASFIPSVRISSFCEEYNRIGTELNIERRAFSTIRFNGSALVDVGVGTP
jgi:hypothetical protein